MWQELPYYQKNPNAILDRLEKLEGELEYDEAQKAFGQFLYANPYLLIKLLTDVELMDFQELAIRTLVKKDYSMFVWGRGSSKTYLIALFIIYYGVCFPYTKIIVAASNFRQTKAIYAEIDKTYQNPKTGYHLKQCIKKMLKSPESWTIEFENGTEAKFLPLGQGEQIRGQRAHVLIVDEFLLMNENIFGSVITPFLSARQNGLRENKIRKAEQILIDAGEMKEEDRTVFGSNKLIVLSSASYKFQYLYSLYQQYISEINESISKKKHCDTAVIKLSYEAVPQDGHLDLKMIRRAKKTTSTREFEREYCSKFLDESGGYFDMQNLNACSVATGNHPTILIKGNPKAKYVLSIDPNYSDSESADNTAMSLLEIDEKTQGATLVHCYALAKSDIRKRADYLKYLFDCFNIVFVIADNAGGKKLFDDMNTLQLLDKKIGFFELDLTNDTKLGETIKNYNVEHNNIVYLQPFQQNLWLRTANEELAFKIQNRLIKFAAPIFNDVDLTRAMNQDIPIDKLYFEINSDEPKTSEARRLKQNDFIDHLGLLIEQTKKEVAIIETKSTPSGHVTFGIPTNLRGDDKDPGRPRKDLYTTLLLGVWGVHLYFEIERIKNSTPKRKSFKPQWVG